MSRRIFCGRNAANTLCLGAFTAMLLGCDAIEKKASDFIEAVKPYVALNAYDQYACGRDETLAAMKKQMFVSYAGEETWNTMMAMAMAEDPVKYVQFKKALDELPLRDGQQVKETTRKGRKVKYCYAKLWVTDFQRTFAQFKEFGMDVTSSAKGVPFLPVCASITETNDRNTVEIKAVADCNNMSLVPRDDLALLMRAAKSKAEPEVPDEEVELE